jgi:hypothetical protein
MSVTTGFALLGSLLAGFSPAVLAQVQITGIVNAASFQSGLASGGGLATVFASGVTGLKPGTYLPFSLPLPYILGGVGVAINGG